MSILTRSCHDCGVTPGHPHYRHCSDYTGDNLYAPELVDPSGMTCFPLTPGVTLKPEVLNELGGWEAVYGAERVVSATGGAKGKKGARLGDLDPLALLKVAEVAGYGADKYQERLNYMRGYDWSLCFDALQRHALAFWGGEDLDPESGLPHLAHAAWHCLALLAFSARDLGTDDRYKEPTL